jgi:anti-sigma factor ChrR (cupin superfamily)
MLSLLQKGQFSNVLRMPFALKNSSAFSSDDNTLTNSDKFILYPSFLKFEILKHRWNILGNRQKFSKTIDLMGGLLGGQSPPKQKMGYL